MKSFLETFGQACWSETSWETGLKIIPLNYINNALSKNLKFHFNLSISNKTINSLPSYYKDIVNSWCKYYFCTSEAPSLVSLQFLWYNSYTKIDKAVCYKDFADKKK